MKNKTRATNKKTKKINPTLTNITVGFQYEFFPLFLDQHGLFVEKCRKIFVPGTPLNIQPDLPAGITIQTDKPSIEIKFMPVKTIIRQRKVFAPKEFDELITAFYSNMKGFFNECKLQYLGAVIETEIILGTKKVLINTPEINKNYRYHVNITVTNSERGLYKIAVDSQKVKQPTFKDITQIMNVASKNLEKVYKRLIK